MIMGHSKHELTQYKNSCCAPEEKVCNITPLPLHRGHILLSSRWPLWRGLTAEKTIKSSYFGARYNDTMIQCTSIITMCRKDHISMRF